MILQPDKQFLIDLAHATMPYGKYEGRNLIDLPEYYVVWYHNKGLPEGKLGQMLTTVYELKVNGLEHIIRNIQAQFPEKD
ncbi:MAG: DUF3820 family protein [Flavobacteriaceae bacterium]|nr:DUF3820 family protein [Flavobacteriaceae bacterium]